MVKMSEWSIEDMDWGKLIEYAIEALLIGWFVYLFAYQNYLLYHWHRGMALPSKTSSLLAGIISGLVFFVYESRNLFRLSGKDSSSEIPPLRVQEANPEAGETAAGANGNINGNNDESEEIKEENELRASALESPQEP